MTYQLIIDETQAGSLELLEELGIEANSIDRTGNGEYTVEGNQRGLDRVIAKYPEAVLKIEAL